jgi:pimeloyl-ACP methyl ester carboxylesterase
MDLQPRATDQPITASLKATYRALLARGLEAGEAANLTAFLHGLPSAGFRWTLPEIEAIVRRRLVHAADQRVAAGTSTPPGTPARARRSPARARRQSRSGATHVMDQPTT